MRSRTETRPTARSRAVEAAGIVIRICRVVGGPLESIADQAIRAASSVALNLAESDGRIGGDRAYHRRVAYGSALEASTALELLLNACAIDEHEAERALDLLDQSRALTWRLLGR